MGNRFAFAIAVLLLRAEATAHRDLREEAFVITFTKLNQFLGPLPVLRFGQTCAPFDRTRTCEGSLLISAIFWRLLLIALFTEKAFDVWRSK